MVDFSALCPSYGTNADADDVECQNCVAKEDCMAQTEVARTEAEIKRLKLTPYGHRPSAMTGKIDMLLYHGTHNLYQIARELDCPVAKVSRHIDVLRRRGFIVKSNTQTGHLFVQKISFKRKNETQNEEVIVERTAQPRNTQAARINACLEHGMTLDQIISEVHLPPTRIKGHIRHLRKKGLTVTETGGILKLES